VAFCGGVALEPLRFEQQRNIAVGVYAAGWRSWHFVNERNNNDPEKEPQFYFDLAIQLIRDQGKKP